MTIAYSEKGPLDEVSRLRAQVRRLTFIVVGCSVVLGLGLFWTGSQVVRLRADVDKYDDEIRLVMQEQARLTERIHEVERRTKDDNQLLLHQLSRRDEHIIALERRILELERRTKDRNP